MDLRWLGKTCFRIAGESGVVVTDPPGTGTEARDSLAADIVTSSSRGLQTPMVPVPTPPFCISGPGEYEVNGVFVVGVRLPGKPPEQEEGDLVTGYCITMEGLTICHLGAVNRPPTQDQIEALGTVDVLILPVGGGVALGPSQAVEVVAVIEPTLIVPMLYRTDDESELEPVGRFCEEMGIQAADAVPELTVSRTRLPIERQVILMEPSAGWRC